MSCGYEALRSVTDVSIPVMPNSIVTAIALILSTLYSRISPYMNDICSLYIYQKRSLFSELFK